MLIIGAKGFAKEILGVLHQRNELDNLVFYDNISQDLPKKLFNQFKILTTFEEVIVYFNEVSDKSFSLGIGNPLLRYQLFKQFEAIGGILSSIISPFSYIAPFETVINQGCNILTGTVIDNCVKIGKGTLVNTNATIGHDSILGDFVEICPGSVISGNCTIGDFSFIGSNATMLPNIKIGSNVIVGAGTLVNKNIPDNALVMGVPGRVTRINPSLL